MSTNLLTAIVLVATVAVGCGDDEPSSGNGESAGGGAAVTTSSLSHDEFVKQASAACSRERKGLIGEVNAYLTKHDSKGMPETVLFANMIKSVMVPTIEAETEAMRELGAPEGDEEEIEAILASQQEAIDEVKGLKNVKGIEDVEVHFKDVGKELRDYGFTACTNG